MIASRLRLQCIGILEHTVLVMCHQGDALIGHAFTTTWDYEGDEHSSQRIISGIEFTIGIVGWITQLVVDINLCKRYVVTSLLQLLKSHVLFETVMAFGLVSSYPVACHTLAKLACIYCFNFIPYLIADLFIGLSMDRVDLSFIGNNT